MPIINVNEVAKMSKKDNIERRLRKIEKEEAKATKMLSKRRMDLAKALEDNDRMIEQAVTRGKTNAELKLETEIEKLSRVSFNMKCETILVSSFGFFRVTFSSRPTLLAMHWLTII